jgi:hypothetical protein
MLTDPHTRNVFLERFSRNEMFKEGALALDVRHAGSTNKGMVGSGAVHLVRHAAEQT